MKKVFSLLLLTVFLTSCQVSFWKPSERHLINSQNGVMRVLTIKNPKDSVALRKTSARLSHRALTSPVFTRLVQGMLTTVTSPEQDGVGIAAPQVGIFRRVVAVQRLDKDEEPFEVYPNIRITAHRGPLQVGQEGCLSVPNEWGYVARYRDIDIEYTSLKTFKDTTERIQGFTAVIFQHECDHLDGVLYIDKLTD
ncbi:MAG: peptide deformylase [Bacteroidales bacterium]|nr:peptide deformylase [Bacteroidales bacterium]MBQ9597880.1 peptide deformylase [Bacteroidales bacterium]